MTGVTGGGKRRHRKSKGGAKAHKAKSSHKSSRKSSRKSSSKSARRRHAKKAEK